MCVCVFGVCADRAINQDLLADNAASFYCTLLLRERLSVEHKVNRHKTTRSNLVEVEDETK